MKKVFLVILIVSLMISLYFNINREAYDKVRGILAEIVRDDNVSLEDENDEFVTQDNKIIFLGDKEIIIDENNKELYEYYSLDGSIYLNVSDLKEAGYTYNYDKNNSILAINGNGKNIVLKENENIIYWNELNFTLNSEVLFIEDEFYLPLDEIMQLEKEENLEGLGFTVSEYGDIVVISSNYIGKTTAVLDFSKKKEDADLSDDLIFIGQDKLGKYKIYDDVECKNAIKYLEEGKSIVIIDKYDIDLLGDEIVQKNPIYKVLLSSGEIGYIDSELIANEISYEAVEYNPQWIQYSGEGKLNLTWDTFEYTPTSDTRNELVGVNVLSPTWYDLTDGDGNLYSTVRQNYLDGARENGFQVWPLVTNSFDIDRTREFLNNYNSRQNFINRLIEDAKQYDYQGINVDFENVYYEDRDALSNFMNEFAKRTREEEIVLSMDVTVMGGSETWSLSSDRKVLGNIVDYLMIMTYDEYWASSPVSGPVASYDWALVNLERIIEIVPKEKVVMGIPLYTRVWYEKPSDSEINKLVNFSEAYGLDYQNSIVKDNNLTPIWDDEGKYYYVAYIDGGYLKKMWMEEAESIRWKASIVNDLDLGGVGTWQKGLESDDIWSVINEEVIK